jgi:hypothetical protein
MSDSTITLDQMEEAVVAYEVADEALEAAAGAGQQRSELHAFLLHGSGSLSWSLTTAFENL